MDPHDRAARKLTPLFPTRVRKWQNAREHAEPAIRTLLDSEFLTFARRVLGDDPLLSLPPRASAKGPVQLGTIIYEKGRPKWPLGLSNDELLQNLAIFGRSGAGKTNCAFLLLVQLIQRKVPFLFLDFKRTARHLLPVLGKSAPTIYTAGRSTAPLPFNPFIAPPGLENRVFIGQVVDLFADAFTLGDGARSILQKALSLAYENPPAPTVADLLKIIEGLPETGRRGMWKVSAVRALESLQFGHQLTSDTAEQEMFAERLARSSTVVELDGLSSSARRFLIPLLCQWLYFVRLPERGREQLSFVIFIEESHHVLYGRSRSQRESIVEMLLRQGREIGLSFIIIDQHPHLISPAVLGNTYASITLNLKDPRDIRKAAELSLIGEVDRELFSRLPVGQAVVKLQDRWTEPILIRVPHVNVPKGSVSDADLRHRHAGLPAGSGRFSGAIAASAGVRRVRVEDGGAFLGDEELRLLVDVETHPHDGVRQRYKRLRFSGAKGQRIKNALIREGYLEGELIPRGNTRSLLLKLTTKARDIIGLCAGDHSPEGIAHAYWKHFYADRYRRAGFDVQVEAPRCGGHVDILVSCDSARIGIEVETGKSNVVRNVRNGLRARLDKIIVIATSPAALGRIEGQLASAGLFIPGRVETALRDQHQPAPAA